MVRLLSEVLKDMRVFFVILFYSTLAFSFILFLRNGNTGFSQSLTLSYKLDLGDMEGDYSVLFDWVIYFLASIINPLIMLNMLISIMGDTYSNVQQSNDIANYQELTEMIIEIEKLMFWKKKINHKHYLQKCDFLSVNEASSGKIFEKIKGLKTQLGGVEDSIKYVKDRLLKNNVGEIENSVLVIRKEQEEMMAEFKQALDKNNEILENFIFGPQNADNNC